MQSSLGTIKTVLSLDNNPKVVLSPDKPLSHALNTIAHQLLKL